MNEARHRAQAGPAIFEAAAASAAPAAEPLRRWHGRLITGVLLAAVVTSTAVFVCRGTAAWNASRAAPGVAVTSGYEEESHFAIFRAIHGLPVYLDLSKPPFASAFFNWLFYGGYAAPLRPVIGITGDTAIVPAGRIITAIGAVAGAITLLLLLREILGGQPALAAALATFVFFGPLVGWWAHTVRPDVWALACETAGLATLLRWREARPWRATAATAFFFYAAWSLKQTYVCGAAAAVLFLAWRGQRRQAAAFALGSAILAAITILALGPIFREMQYSHGFDSDYYLAGAVRNFCSALEKLSPLVLLAIAALTAKPHPAAMTPSLQADARSLGLIGLGVTLPLAVAASSKLGASTNYFFSAGPLLAILAAGGLAQRPRSFWVFAGAFAMLAIQVATLGGRAGRVDLEAQKRSVADSWAMFRELPEPRFTSDNRLELPWLNPQSPPFVLAYNYDLERRAGTRFAAGGVGGLIEAGYFASLLLPANTTDAFLGGKLTRYKRGTTAHGLTVYLRSAQSSSNP